MSIAGEIVRTYIPHIKAVRQFELVPKRKKKEAYILFELTNARSPYVKGMNIEEFFDKRARGLLPIQGNWDTIYSIAMKLSVANLPRSEERRIMTSFLREEIESLSRELNRQGENGKERPYYKREIKGYKRMMRRIEHPGLIARMVDSVDSSLRRRVR